ncbi:unnamed protein product [Leptidea sinapis]|uniref:TLDc domain-containing protein n=1 Tax=Leptidea sinapis TaxID=189913 RepID=A0A5E4PTR9_9NEOP|nr:unnamed protein product [Leptidea sinapis]
MEVEGAGSGTGIELSTPVLERGGPVHTLLPVSCAWLVAATLSHTYTRPLMPPKASSGGAGGTSASAAWMSRLVCALPSHWVPLYSSDEHGLGANRSGARPTSTGARRTARCCNCSPRLRAGSDPRKPTLAVEEDFDRFHYQGAPYVLNAIEVWGCGEQAAREAQLDVKKWQVREAERQRQVKISAADWIEHPDRYLLELAGRPQYNNSAS